MAGSSELVANFAKKPLGYKLGVLAGVAAVCGFLYWQFFYSTLSDQEKQLTLERQKLAKTEKKLKERKKQWEDLLKQKAELDQQIKKNAVTLPASSELPAFFVHLQKQAAAAGVTVKKWSRKKESEVESYVRVPVSIEITGSFYQINNYFRLLSQTDRIITVENLTLGAARVKNDEVMLTAKFIATTFRQKDRPPDTSIEEEDDKPAPKRTTPAKATPPAGAGRRAGQAIDAQNAVRNETGNQAARETAGGAR